MYPAVRRKIRNEGKLGKYAIIALTSSFGPGYAKMLPSNYIVSFWELPEHPKPPSVCVWRTVHVASLDCIPHIVVWPGMSICPKHHSYIGLQPERWPGTTLLHRGTLYAIVTNKVTQIISLGKIECETYKVSLYTGGWYSLVLEVQSWALSSCMHVNPAKLFLGSLDSANRTLKHLVDT